MIDPIIPLDFTLKALRDAKPSAPLQAQLDALVARRSQLKSQDTAQWAGVYQETLALISSIVAEYKKQQEEQQKSQQEAESKRKLQQQIGALAHAVPQQLQKALNDWNGRLQQQAQQIEEKAEKSIQKLEVTPREDASLGETIFQITPEHLGGFLQWLSSAEADWRKNNGQLVAERANGLLEAIPFPETARFRVVAATFAPETSATPQLKGHKILTPSKLEALGTTQKIVTAAIGGVTMLSMTATRVLGNQATLILSWGLGLVFVASLVYAAITVPSRYAQAMNRQASIAREQAQRELLNAVKARISREEKAQLAAIKKHLQEEEKRWGKLVKDLGGGGPVGLAPMAPMGGLMPQDLARLQGEWRDAIAARRAQLAGA